VDGTGSEPCLQVGFHISGVEHSAFPIRVSDTQLVI